jgi:hypothetical protein
MSGETYGTVACFATPGEFRAAFADLRAAGYTRLEANVPFAVEGLEELLPGPPTPIARIVLVAGVIGGTGGYFLQWYATRDFPLNVGGRPIHSWPAFVPVTFELTVLTAAMVGVLALLWLTRLPRLHHPILGATGIERATQDRFFLCVRADDPRFDAAALAARLKRAGAERVEEVRT